jgi:hypothetical protein
MTPISKRAAEHIEIRDDEDAKVLLLECGILDKFQKRGPLAEEWAETLTYADHPTHWIIATRFTGFALASDNGFHIMCYPKSHISLQEANRILQEWKRKMFPDDPPGRFSPVDHIRN